MGLEIWRLNFLFALDFKNLACSYYSLSEFLTSTETFCLTVQPTTQCLPSSAGPAHGRTHGEQLIKNHLVKSTNKAVSFWHAHGTEEGWGGGGVGWSDTGGGFINKARWGELSKILVWKQRDWFFFSILTSHYYYYISKESELFWEKISKDISINIYRNI